MSTSARIQRLIAGKRVLVTGAGGSIGSELSRQIHTFAPAELILLDRDESALHALQLDLYGLGLLDTRDIALCDIRDREALAAIFAEHRPEVIFHAAALKHLPLLELYPAEGWKTNVLGTANLLQLAAQHEVEVFVNISTDKAADPTTVLGRTKHVAERLTAAYATRFPNTHFESVRLGNVIGSRGSVLWTFRHQIAHGGPVTITHPQVERYFMTVSQACELILQAVVSGANGAVLVIDMGRPVLIREIAEKLIAASGKEIEIVYTGLRPGEKLTEELTGKTEVKTSAKNSRIGSIEITPLTPEELPGIRDWALKRDQTTTSS